MYLEPVNVDGTMVHPGMGETVRDQNTDDHRACEITWLYPWSRGKPSKGFNLGSNIFRFALKR